MGLLELVICGLSSETSCRYPLLALLWSLYQYQDIYAFAT